MSYDGDPTLRRQLKQLAASVFPDRISIGVAAISVISLKLEEMRAVERAVPARWRELSAGRRAARQAMGQDVSIPIGPDRAPVWPAGVSGSITHAGGWALAATGTGLIGIDLEEDDALPEDIRETVLLPQERHVDGRIARLIFSAKECAYKAQYPVTRELFGFETFHITLGDGTFRAEFQHDVGRFAKGDVLDGCYAIGNGFILTGISQPLE